MTSKNYMILFPPGSGGNFLANFLNPEVLDPVVPCWCLDEYTVASNKYRASHLRAHVFKSSVIKINPANTDDLLKMCINQILKSNGLYKILDLSSLFYVNKVVMTVNTLLSTGTYGYGLNYNDVMSTNDVDILFYYRDIFNIDSLANLYITVNKTDLPDFKKSYAISYINEHKEFYSTPFYNCISQIITYEYENNLIGKQRQWSIFDIDLHNYENFLKNALDLNNYI